MTPRAEPSPIVRLAANIRLRRRRSRSLRSALRPDLQEKEGERRSQEIRKAAQRSFEFEFVHVITI